MTQLKILMARTANELEQKFNEWSKTLPRGATITTSLPLYIPDTTPTKRRGSEWSLFVFYHPPR